MSAQIPDTMLLSDLLKSTGYDCPADMQEKTFAETTAGGDCQTNKSATIDVSTYTEPVEVEPAEGYESMKKATVTLTNIPSGGGTMSTNMPSWTYNEGDEDDGSGQIDVSRVIPDGVKVYYYDDNRGAGVLTGDGVKAIADYYIHDCYFISSCGDDIAVYVESSQPEEG